jgi:hypothetical protein
MIPGPAVTALKGWLRKIHQFAVAAKHRGARGNRIVAKTSIKIRRFSP